MHRHDGNPVALLPVRDRPGCLVVEERKIVEQFVRLLRLELQHHLLRRNLQPSTQTPEQRPYVVLRPAVTGRKEGCLRQHHRSPKHILPKLTDKPVERLLDPNPLLHPNRTTNLPPPHPHHLPPTQQPPDWHSPEIVETPLR